MPTESRWGLLFQNQIWVRVRGEINGNGTNAGELGLEAVI